MMNQDELNNQGDYISGATGPDGKDVVVGKNISTARTSDDSRRDTNNNTFTFAAGDNQAFQLFQLLQDVRYQVLEVKTQQTQSTSIITEKLDTNNRRLSSLELEFINQRREIEALKEHGNKRDEILDAIQTKVNAPPVIVAAATTIQPFHFWIFLLSILLIAVIVVLVSFYLMRGV